MVIGGYFDESIREGGKEPIVVGGYLFKPARYVRFRERWSREVLRLPNRKRLKHFHMTDLCAGKGVYGGLDIPTRVGILKRAVDVVGACAYGAIGVQFDQAEYEAAAPPEWAKYRGSIYGQACTGCVQMTAYWLRQWRCHNIEVLYVFERGHKFQSNAEDMLHAIAANADARSQFRYRNHLFEEKERECGLQAADLFAWSMSKSASISGGPIPPAFRPFVSEVVRLAERLPGRQHLTRFTGDRLRRYMAEQAAAVGGIPVAFRAQRARLR